MKDTKFIELLNLYVDHQISAADADLLEDELQRNPKRHQVYRQYCQMQKACSVLAENFRTQAPEEKVIVSSNSVRESRRFFSPFAYATGLLAAAACVAMVFMSRNRMEQSPAGTPSAAVAQTAPVNVVVPTVLPMLARPALQPAFAGIVREKTASVSGLTITDRAPLDWMNQVQVGRVPVKDLKFQSLPTLPTEDLTFRNNRAFETQAEMTAFRFQR